MIFEPLKIQSLVNIYENGFLLLQVKESVTKPIYTKMVYNAFGTKGLKPCEIFSCKKKIVRTEYICSLF